MQCPARPSGCFVLSHPNIDTRKISCPPQARPVPWPPGLALLLPVGQRGRQALALSAYVQLFLPNPPRQDKEMRGRLHTSTLDPLQASWWQPTTKPERAGDFLETSWNCSEQREKQLDSRGIHCVRGRGSKKPLIVYTLNSFTTNRMLSREREKCL